MSTTDTSESRSKETVVAGETGMVSHNINSLNEKVEREARQKVENPVEIPRLDSSVLKQLALQLEYYFSTHNLSKDTYVQTLRNLNDGCVPVRILANFGKVKTILSLNGNASFLDEECRINAILDTIRDTYTGSLHIHSVDAKTGKIVSTGCSEVAVPGKTILAIGTVTKDPLTVDPLTTSPLLMSRSIASPVLPKTNTIILRDVPLSVTEGEIRSLLNEIEACPLVTTVTKDVANCW
jgi:hypothetical protein